jgi:hypothetical protein
MYVYIYEYFIALQYTNFTLLNHLVNEGSIGEGEDRNSNKERKYFRELYVSGHLR